MQQNKHFGYLAAFGCYALWGILPLYWHMLAEAEANEILAHRVLWSVVFMLIVLVVTRRLDLLKKDCRELWQNKKRGTLLVAAAVIISVNWLTYIWAVNHNHVIETSIGYYINPLVNVLFGVAIFGETLSAPKKLSIVLAATGIFLMTWQIGKLPWVSVALALTFGSYGALKKMLKLNPFTSITLETLLLFPFAFYYVANLTATGAAHFGPATPLLSLLLAGCGIATAVPLILFSYGANLLPLNVLGFFQYISPSMTLLLGIFFFNEPFGTTQLFTFGFIWLALIVFTISEWKASRS
ncbi:MAG: EamA family transporter RarD [Acidaminococcaceae bacterium]|nr:EamA family transporter RarD [Acidaminococcaceae bacterium]MBR2182735.1 EamA family transporter RarD [Acidaminococcaceae bacterium]